MYVLEGNLYLCFGFILANILEFQTQNARKFYLIFVILFLLAQMRSYVANNI